MRWRPVVRGSGRLMMPDARRPLHGKAALAASLTPPRFRAGSREPGGSAPSHSRGSAARRSLRAIATVRAFIAAQGTMPTRGTP
jgi:hypothetical protein